MRTPLVLIMMWRIGRARAAATISQNKGWMVGSPPESWTRSGSPSAFTTASSIASTSARLVWPPFPTALSAKQTGQVRLQASLISTMARQLCCSWSGQRPQSQGQPRSVRLALNKGRSPGFSQRRVRQPVIGILLDQRLRHAMIGAALLVEDPAVLADDLGRHQLPAGLAEARRLAVEEPGHALAREAQVRGRRARPSKIRA